MILRVGDIETTGTEPPAEIVEIGYCEVSTVDFPPTVGPVKSKLFAPVTPCPPEVVAVHHITAADLEGCEACTPAILAGIARSGSPAALVAHNAEFEGLWFTEELRGAVPLLCTYKAAMRVWPDAPRHSNQVLRYWLGLDLPAENAMPPHRAGPDAFVTAHILIELLKRATVDEMLAWTLEPKAYPTIPFGKHRGKRWSDPEVPSDYFQWMERQADLDPDAKWCAGQELQRRRAG